MPTTSSIPPLPTPEPSVAAPIPNLVEQTGSPQWLVWIFTALGLLLAGIAGLWWFQQRKLAPANAPTIEPPLARKPAAGPAVSPTRNAQPDPESVTKPLSPMQAPMQAPMQVRIEVESLSRSMRFATLATKIEIANAGGKPLSDIALDADLTTAHGSIAIHDQLAGAETQLEPLDHIEMLEEGGTVSLKKQVRLPLLQVRPIRQGRAVLYVPLLRLRVSSEGIDPILRTFVIGMRPAIPGDKLQPFRLDETPQTYRMIGARILD